MRGAIKPVSGRAADLDRTNPGGGNLVGLILPIGEANSKHCQRNSSPERVTPATATVAADADDRDNARAPAPERRQALVAFVEQARRRSRLAAAQRPPLARPQGGSRTGPHRRVGCRPERHDRARPGVPRQRRIGARGRGRPVGARRRRRPRRRARDGDRHLPRGGRRPPDVVDRSRTSEWSARGVAEQAGLALERSLHEMRVALPLESRVIGGDPRVSHPPTPTRGCGSTTAPSPTTPSRAAGTATPWRPASPSRGSTPTASASTSTTASWPRSAGRRCTTR